MGHNYTLFITVKGEVNEDTGFVIDLKKLSQIINEKVIEIADHRNINLEVPFMKGKLASTENLAISIWNELYEDIRKPGSPFALCETRRDREQHSRIFRE